DYVSALGLRRWRLLVNSMGDEACRPAYRELLVAHLAAREAQLCDEHRPMYRDNPLRVLDCKRDGCREATADAPHLADHLCDPCRAHFDRVVEGLGALGIEHELDPRLVRGFDYYTRTTFELQSDAIDAAQ